MDTKKLYGAFYTTNCDYIFQDMYIDEALDTIIEPFAGNGDIILWCKRL